MRLVIQQPMEQHQVLKVLRRQQSLRAHVGGSQGLMTKEMLVRCGLPGQDGLCGTPALPAARCVEQGRRLLYSMGG